MKTFQETYPALAFITIGTVGLLDKVFPEAERAHTNSLSNIFAATIKKELIKEELISVVKKLDYFSGGAQYAANVLLLEKNLTDYKNLTKRS